MAPRKQVLPDYGVVTVNGKEYYRTRMIDQDGKRFSLYGSTKKELHEKVLETQQQIEERTFRQQTPSVREYCEKWLLMKSANVRETTMIDYRSKVKNHIIAPLGKRRMGDVTADDIRMALVPVSEKSASVFKSVVVLYKSIFNSAIKSKVISQNPTAYLSAKGGGVPQEERAALTDEQAERLIKTVEGLPPVSIRADWLVYRASAGRDPWPQMGFRLSGCRCPLFDCSAGMAYGKQQTGDPERTENEGGKAKYTYSYSPAGGIA